MAVLPHSFAAATVAAHKDILRVVRAMPRLAWTVVALLAFQLGIDLMGQWLVPAQSLLGRNLPEVVYYFLFTPVFIAVHRFLILGEVTTHYRLDWHDNRFQSFFGWAFMLSAAAALLSAMPQLSHHWSIVLLAAILAILLMIALVRLSILFPAIAADAPGATASNAFADTRGHGLRIFLYLLIPFLPSAAAFVLLAFLLVSLFGSAIGYVLLLPLLTVGALFCMVLTVIIASRIYEGLGDQLNRPDGS